MAAKTPVEKRDALLARANKALEKAEARNDKAKVRAEKANASIAGVNAKAAVAKEAFEVAKAHAEWVANMPVAAAVSAFDEEGAEVVAEVYVEDEDADEDELAVV